MKYIIGILACMAANVTSPAMAQDSENPNYKRGETRADAEKRSAGECTKTGPNRLIVLPDGSVFVPSGVTWCEDKRVFTNPVFDPGVGGGAGE